MSFAHLLISMAHRGFACQSCHFFSPHTSTFGSRPDFRLSMATAITHTARSIPQFFQ